jgi:glycosyltransferase involved in cell wall biosynthesis
MSCYERYDYLLKSINSLLAQTYTNFEIIVVLEKSDKQLEIEEFLKDIDDDRIKIIKNKEKLGFAASLNVGIDVAKGKYIARMDDDDIAMLQRFQIQVDFMEKNPNVGIVGGNMQVFGNNHETFAVFSEDRFIKATTLFCVPFMHPTVMMRKKMFDENNLRYDPDYFTEDYELWSRAVYCFECANIPKVLTFYRSHGSQATGNNDLKIHNSHKKVMHNLLRKQLKIDLSENEIEVLQMRKGVIDKVMDTDGAFAIRQKAMDRVIEANREQKVFDERALWYIINLGKPNLVDGKAVDGLFEIKEQKAKKRLKHIIKPVISPIYKRLIGKMETIMMNHDEELRISLQRQIDEIKKDRE